MRQFELLDAMTFKHGRFKLTDEQFANRRYVTRLVGVPSEMVVEPIVEISFKRGEIITTDLEITRAIELKLRPLELTEPSQASVVNQAGGVTDRSAGGTSGEVQRHTAAPTVDDDPLAGVIDTPPTGGQLSDRLSARAGRRK